MSPEYTANTPQQGRLFWICNNPSTMETQLASNPFFFIVDDFGIEYVGGKHVHHLRQFLQENYEIS